MRSSREQAATSHPGSPQHPLELPHARRYFLGAVALAALTSPVSIVAMMLALWAVSNNPVTPAAGALLGLIAMAYVERRYRSDAWAHIPRRRQDKGRDEPGLLSMVTSFGQTLWLLVASGLIVGSARQDVESLAVGALLGLIGCVVLTLAWDLRAPADRRVLFAPSSVELGFVTAVVLVAAVTVVALAGESTDFSAVAVGGALALSVTLLGLSFRLIPRRVACLPSGFSAE